jgi:hypothetical protein
MSSVGGLFTYTPTPNFNRLERHSLYYTRTYYSFRNYCGSSPLPVHHHTPSDHCHTGQWCSTVSVQGKPHIRTRTYCSTSSYSLLDTVAVPSSYSHFIVVSWFHFINAHLYFQNIFPQPVLSRNFISTKFLNLKDQLL